MKIEKSYREKYRVKPLFQKKKKRDETFRDFLEESISSKKKDVEKQIKKQILDILI